MSGAGNAIPANSKTCLLAKKVNSFFVNYCQNLEKNIHNRLFSQKTRYNIIRLGGIFHEKNISDFIFVIISIYLYYASKC